MSRTDSAAIAVSYAGLGAMIAGIFGLYFRHALFASGPWIAVQVAAALLMLWARITFGGRSFHAGANPTEGGLVTAGPYAFLRHPIYAAILWFAWTGVFMHLSFVNAALGLLLTLGAAMRIAMEERELRARYPDYAAYASRTRRVIPFVL